MTKEEINELLEQYLGKFSTNDQKFQALQIQLLVEIGDLLTLK